MTKAELRKKLIRALQWAYSGELAAYHAYEGHWKSVKDPREKKEIHQIQRDEWEHRECLAGFLKQLGSAPDIRLEFMFTVIGRTISFLCYLGGWFIPMYGAGKLESGNIIEYEIAAQWARLCGEDHMIHEFLHMAEVEWDHELYFRTKAESHWLYRFFPKWTVPAPRDTIRERYLTPHVFSEHLGA